MSVIKVDTIQDTSGNDQFTVKAWVTLDSTGTLLVRASGNVSSVVDNSTGDYTINFSNSFADDDYAVAGAGQNAVAITDGLALDPYVMNTGDLRVIFINNNGDPRDGANTCVTALR